MDLTYGIDLTVSNGNYIKGEYSLHSINQVGQNVYTRVMSSVGNNFKEFTKEDNYFKTLGFGAKTLERMEAPALNCIEFHQF